MHKTIKIFLILLVIFSITANWLLHSPPGLFGKLFKIGSSVCHQIPSHSFEKDGVQFPLCARCAGLYLGSFIGITYYLTLGKKSGIPKRGYAALLIILFVIWGADGFNSFMSDLLNRPFLYETTNLTRLITGLGMGFVMSTALVTLFNLTIWKESLPSPLLSSIWQIASYGIAAAILGWLLINGSDILFMIFAYISIGMVLTIITLLYAIFWVIILRKENSFTRWKTLTIYLVGGFGTTMLQITLLNMLRQWIIS